LDISFQWRKNMNAKITVGVVAVALLGVLVALPLWSEDDPGAAKPGPEHVKLAKKAGAYDVGCKFTMAPGQPPSESKATAEFKSILDGKYLQQTFAGEVGGMKYTGMGVEGYDPATKKHTFYWCDSLSTTPMYAVGESKDGGKTIENRTEMTDPDTGRSTKIRCVTTQKSDDEFTFAMYGEQGGGEALMFELAYTRKK